MSKCCLKPGIAIDLAGNVADHSAEIVFRHGIRTPFSG
jgi:hypothetical protein